MEINNKASRVKGLLLQLPNLKITTRPDENSRFNLFPMLPFELRALVWQHDSYNNPRNISLQVRENVFNPSPRLIECPRTIPALLHTCHEARKESV
jgi:hypothetical protein